MLRLELSPADLETARGLLEQPPRPPGADRRRIIRSHRALERGRWAALLCVAAIGHLMLWLWMH